MYFAYHMFQGIQQSKYLEHFRTLVRAILILLGPQVVKREIETACRLLKEFVEQFEVNNLVKGIILLKVRVSRNQKSSEKVKV